MNIYDIIIVLALHVLLILLRCGTSRSGVHVLSLSELQLFLTLAVFQLAHFIAVILDTLHGHRIPCTLVHLLGLLSLRSSCLVNTNWEHIDRETLYFTIVMQVAPGHYKLADMATEILWLLQRSNSG